MSINTLKAAVREHFAALEEANTALEGVDADAPEAEVKELEARFDVAESNHKVAVEKLERAEKLEAARGALPVEPVEETPAEVREVKVGKEELVYRSDLQGPSFFRDVAAATKGDSRAGERLAASAKQVADERALDSSNTTGGEFIPPVWLLDEYAAYARAGRATANIVNRRPLPAGTDSINIPAVTGGSATAAQTDGNSVQSTDPVTATITAPVITIAGQVDLSRQSFERSADAGTGLEQVLGADLAADYAKQIDVQVLNGSGSSGNAQGIIGLSGNISVTYTDSTPSGAELYPSIANAIQQIHSNRFLPPTHIVMHPRRWNWLASSVDTSGRPFVVPTAAYNAAGTLDSVQSEGVVGHLMGLPVVVDANVPTTISSTQDPILIFRASDSWLWEDTPKVRVFEEVLSGTGQIRVQLFSYAAFATRYAKSVAKITGTGVTTPTF